MACHNPKVWFYTAIHCNTTQNSAHIKRLSSAAMDRGSTSSCPVDSWKIQCNQLHVLLEAAGNATSSRPCLNFHLFGQDIQSQSLRSSLLDLHCVTIVQFLAQHASLYLTELDVSFAKSNQRVLRCNGHRVHLLSAAQGQHTMWLKLHVKNRPNLTWPG